MVATHAFMAVSAVWCGAVQNCTLSRITNNSKWHPLLAPNLHRENCRHQNQVVAVVLLQTCVVTVITTIANRTPPEHFMSHEA